ncbi:MAG: GspH/FimT family pseudopilin [Gammaproteobacteria bacterium]|nr:GspH/FimT family pseudopilin [Gammaproteobacteria bacterium]
MLTNSKNSGFTIIEAMVVLAIFGVLASLTAPAMSDFLDEVQATQNTNDLLASLLLARSEAVTRNSIVSMCMINPASPNICNTSNSWQDGWIAFEDLDGDGVRDVGEEIIDTHTSMDDTSVVVTANFDEFLRYRPSGAITSGGSFSICVGGSVAKSVVINATGRPRVADATCP